MSLHTVAQHIAAKGRGPDQLLVHMAPGEVAGLQALAKAHGGSLTVNPQTGLPEAGFLSNILPALIGVGLTAATGGAAAPWMIGLGVGGAQALRTGSLMKGLQAGLGAYGGAGLGAGLSELGASAVAPEAVGAANASTDAIANVAAAKDAATAAGAVPKTGLDALTSGFQQAVENPTALANTMGGWGNVSKAGLMAASPIIADAMIPTTTQAPYKGSGPNPYNFNFSWERGAPGYDSREYSQLRGVMTPIRHAEGGPISDMSEQNAQLTLMANGGQMLAEGGQAKDVAQGMTGASAGAMRYLMGQSAVSPATAAAQNYNVKPATPQMAVVKHQPLPSNGGLISRMVSAMGNTEPDPNVPYSFNFNPATGSMSPDAPVMRQIIPTATTMDAGNYAGGGIAALGGYSDGGRMLRGPGDGVSDSIPAVIGDRSPARLADGEFVVPARIVSELGNGSSEAGARKLYAMMDRVQKARSKTTGKNKVAVNSRADKALPA